MPKPVCVTCNSSSSLLWRAGGGGQLCHHCYQIESGNGATASTSPERETPEADEIKQEEGSSTSTASINTTAIAKSAKKGGNRWTRARSGTSATSSTTSTCPPKPTATPRGRGRRALFKRPPLKAPSPTATVVTSDTVYFNGSYMQVGDIVSMLDDVGDTYYAQLRGFITDQYCEKSAVVTWLLPTKASPPPSQCFDPATYIIGPEEDLPRKLEYMEFVMHAPSDYYKSSTSPYPPVEAEMISKSISGFVWSSMDTHYKL